MLKFILWGLGLLAAMLTILGMLALRATPAEQHPPDSLWLDSAEHYHYTDTHGQDTDLGPRCAELDTIYYLRRGGSAPR